MYEWYFVLLFDYCLLKGKESLSIYSCMFINIMCFEIESNRNNIYKI